MTFQEVLSRLQAPIEVIHHHATTTSKALARALHVDAAVVAKTVLVKTASGFVVVLLPADRQVDFEELKQLLETPTLRLATEDEMESIFPDVERGVVPPFGSLYGIRTVVDIHLAADGYLLFEGRDHSEAIRISYEDFALLENPTRGIISTEREGENGR